MIASTRLAMLTVSSCLFSRRQGSTVGKILRTAHGTQNLAALVSATEAKGRLSAQELGAGCIPYLKVPR